MAQEQCDKPHERRVVGHASGWQEQMDTCVCGKPWPCPSAVSHAPRIDGWCPACKGSGTMKGMTQGHGPDDYEIDIECSTCGGTGAGTIPSTTPQKTVDAPSLFDAWDAWNKVDWAMYERVSEIFGAGVEDVSHDSYDASLEVYSSADIEPTREQVDAVRSMGFAQFWINFPDETQIHCGENIGRRVKRSYNKWRSGGRRTTLSAIAPNDEALEKANGRIAALEAKLAESRREYDELEARSATRRSDPAVALVRQAILYVLDERGWLFYDDNEDIANMARVEFADAVVAWLAKERV